MALVQTSASANAAGLQAIMSLENKALAAKDLVTLRYIAVNHPRSVIQAGHIFWITREGQKLKIEAMSSQSNLDSTTPFALWMARQLNLRAKRGELTDLSEWVFEDSQNETPFTYPFTHGLFVPLARDGQQGGLLFTRENPFKDVDRHLALRLGKVFGLAALAHRGKGPKPISIRKPLVFWASVTILVLASAIPVPMTTLAPAEIVAKDPFVVTAPFDGIVEDILVPANWKVKKGTPIIQYADSAAADAPKKLAQSPQGHATDHPLKTLIRSPQHGLATYEPTSDWRGRPVQTGEAIIHIVNPANLSLRIEAPLSMGESLNPGTRVKLFLDNSPLKPLEAEITSASYYAKTMPDGHMAYETHANLHLTNSQALPRIGSRGVAKIYGPKAPLAYWLLRRPITILRQTLGV